MVFYPWSHLPCCSVSCPPVSRLGHYPEAGAHFVNTRVQGDTMHPDSHTSGFSWLYLPFIVPVSRYHLPRSDLGTGKASDRCNSTTLENSSSVMIKWFCIPGCLCCVTADFYGNWTSHPSHIRIHFWVITHAHQASSCFEVATKQETETLNSHEKIATFSFSLFSSSSASPR